jgi:hypothetical protein
MAWGGANCPVCLSVMCNQQIYVIYIRQLHITNEYTLIFFGTAEYSLLYSSVLHFSEFSSVNWWIFLRSIGFMGIFVGFNRWIFVVSYSVKKDYHFWLLDIPFDCLSYSNFYANIDCFVYLFYMSKWQSLKGVTQLNELLKSTCLIINYHQQKNHFCILQ